MHIQSKPVYFYCPEQLWPGIRHKGCRVWYKRPEIVFKLQYNFIPRNEVVTRKCNTGIFLFIIIKKCIEVCPTWHSWVVHASVLNQTALVALKVSPSKACGTSASVNLQLKSQSKTQLTKRIFLLTTKHSVPCLIWALICMSFYQLQFRMFISITDFLALLLVISQNIKLKFLATNY